MKNLIFLLINILLYLSSFVQSQTIIEAGEVSGTWDQTGSPYLVEGDVIIANDSVLTIHPGVEIIFNGHYELKVHGNLNAIGNENNNILFTVADTTGFSDTTSVSGGWHGIRFMDNQSSDTSFLVYCILSFGKAVGDELEDKFGGAIYSNNYSFLYISGSRIIHNMAYEKGGGIYYNNSDVIIEYSEIKHNRSFYYGGGIANGISCGGIVQNNIIARNIALRIGSYWMAGCGGGFYASDAFNLSPTVQNNLICNNLSLNGGGIYESTSLVWIISNIICNNRGVGIFNGHSIGQGRYINNTIVHNATKGGITTYSSNILIENNIIWGNSNGFEWEQINLEMGANPTVIYNNIQNGFNGEGNINEEPLFVDPTVMQDTLFNALLADWSLMEESPCINAGNPDTTGLNLPYYDLNGNYRMYGVRVDMGALENQLVTGFKEAIGNNICEVYPNPARNIIFIEGDKIESITINNINGSYIDKVIFNRNSNYINQLDISFLEKGTYVFTIHTGTKVSSVKVVKL